MGDIIVETHKLGCTSFGREFSKSVEGRFNAAAARNGHRRSKL
jgi:hypothetical protein